MLGLLEPNLDKITAFEYTCYASAEYAANTIEAEEIDKANRKARDGQSDSPEKFGASTTLSESAFGNWEE